MQTITYTPDMFRVAEANHFAQQYLSKGKAANVNHPFRAKQVAVGKLGEMAVADYLDGYIDLGVYGGYGTEPDVELDGFGGVHVKTCDWSYKSWLVDLQTLAERPSDEWMIFVAEEQGTYTLCALLQLEDVVPLLRETLKDLDNGKRRNPKMALYWDDVPEHARLR